MVQLDEILIECLQTTKNSLFYRAKWENRPIDAFNPHQRSGLNASIRNSKIISWPSDHGWTLRINPLDMRLKAP